MNNSKTVKILASLTPEELKQFEKFICSPYFSKGRQILPLFKDLKNFYPDFDHADLKRKTVYGRIYPNEKFNDIKFRVLLTELHNLCKKFLSYNEFKNNKTCNNRFLAEALYKKKLFGEFEKQVKYSSSFLDNSKRDGFEYNLEKFFIERMVCHYMIESNNSVMYPQSYLKFSESFMKVFFIQLLLNYSELSSYRFSAVKEENKALHKYLFEVIDFNTLPQRIVFPDDKENKHFLLYYYSCMLSINRSRDEYENLKKIFFEIKDSILTPDNKRLMYARLLNYCSTAVGTGFKEESLYLYKKMLGDDDEVMNEGPHFGRTHFRNIINLSIPCGELKWTEEFIHKYSPKLNPPDIENMLNFSLGYLAFGKKEFGRSMEFLSKVKFGLMTFKEDVSSLMLFNLYELELYEQALALVNTYHRTFKRTPSMHEALYKDYKNTLECYPLLLNAKLNNDLSGIRYIEELSKRSVNLTVKNWFAEKIIELKKKAAK